MGKYRGQQVAGTDRPGLGSGRTGKGGHDIGVTARYLDDGPRLPGGPGRQGALVGRYGSGKQAAEDGAHGRPRRGKGGPSRDDHSHVVRHVPRAMEEAQSGSVDGMEIGLIAIYGVAIWVLATVESCERQIAEQGARVLPNTRALLPYDALFPADGGVGEYVP